ncbi:Metal-dependent hydrolase, composite domain [Phaffia rhodozyma]|uniref:Metal-dependent hydrolase, composite domain n=1 Tax=Phaffia rhodozyma TaxID=264483 RepID=A0A0F7SNP5_PHARH|nr:Metal-dependent hydrolase, composite domain [Phaffia rhodozyma]
MGLPAYASNRPASEATALPRWVHYLPLLLLAPLISDKVTSTLFPPAQPSFIQVSDRFVPGTQPVLLTNATIWTGNKDGQEVILAGSVLLEGGLIKAISKSKDDIKDLLKRSCHVHEIDVGGKWITPGIVDMHSHLGVSSSPDLKGSSDTNSLKAPILPYLRSIDGINTHDAAYNLSIAGGITTALILPGSANNIGGQAFVIKPRQTAENTPSSMVLENPWVIDDVNGGLKRTGFDRHMKHACGENIHRVYNDNRFDQGWNFRKAYNKATQIRAKQDAWCAKGKLNTEEFPDELEWEALVDVLRGKVKVNVHCYETVDFDQLIRLTNEFKFELAAVHHAHEAWLVTDLIKKSYGITPTAAIFATNARYKRESFRGSEFAPKFLAENGINVAMKSDHPVLDSRYLVFEAAQAHHYGLNASLALSSVTTTPARAIGKDHRIGYLRDGYDADVVVWDSHPLTLGATPLQTYIDGIPQLEHPHFAPSKPAKLQAVPSTPDWDDEPELHRQARGDPDYAAILKKRLAKNVVFKNVRNVFLKNELNDLVASSEREGENKMVIVEGGKIVQVCDEECSQTLQKDWEVIDLKNGSVLPGLVSFGSPLGLEEIAGEKSTKDGSAPDGSNPASSLGVDEVLYAVDGASFATKNALIAALSGVSVGVVAPDSSSLVSGVSFAFDTAADGPLSPRAIRSEAVALHVNVGHGFSSSISNQIGQLRKLLLGKTPDADGWWKKATQGEIPLVVAVDKADIIARLIQLKKSIQEETGDSINLVIHGGSEAHLLAKELAEANVGVLLAPARSFPTGWDQRRILAGPPITASTPVDVLVNAGVTVGLAIVESWQARNTRFEAAWALLASSSLTTKSALELVTTNVEKLLGLDTSSTDGEGDWFAVEGDFFGFEGKVVARGGGSS